MKYIVGLGNPGQEYENNRHNIGFLLLDYIAGKLKCDFSKEKNYLIAKKRAYSLIKPLTYMNNSGLAVRQLISDQFKELMIVVDDIYLPFGEIRIREKGGDGGHNGLKSIIENMNSDEFIRIRIGVDSPKYGDLKRFVLEDFSENEIKILNHTFEFAYELIKQYIHRDYTSMLNYYSKNKRSYSECMADIQNQRPKEEHK